MVDLSRKISVTQARQGGFSALFLPGTVLYEKKSCVFYWSGTDLLSTGSETIVISGYIPEEGLASSTLLSQPAVQVDFFTQLEVQSGLVSTISNANYTIEWFGSVPNTGALTESVLAISFYKSFYNDYVSTGINYESDNSPPSVAFIKTFKDVLDESTPATWTNPVHIAQQRIGDQLFLHVNGQQVTSVIDSDNALDSSAGFIVTANATSALIIGQGRLTVGAGIYGTSNFTPPTEAFYVPPTP
jgi:hypothetical protein